MNERILWQMIEAFFRRWRMTRKLYKYIFLEEDITPVLGSTTSRIERMRQGAEENGFLKWLKWEWEGWRHEDFAARTSRPDTFWETIKHNLPWRKKTRQAFDEWAKQTLKECIELGYIERTPGYTLRLGYRGMDIRSWYYPVIAFFSLRIPAAIIGKGIDWGIPLLLIYIFARFLGVHFNVTS